MAKRIMLAVLAAVLVLVVLGVIFFLLSAGRPLYQPGMVRAEKGLRAPLQPQAQTAGDQLWLVEPEVKLFHFEEGSGPVILVLHGGPGYPYVGPPPGFHQLADHHRMIYYHQRGCGNSTRPVDKFPPKSFYRNMLSLDKALGLGAQIADIERIRRILGEEKLTLVGHSFGAFMAALYAAEFPEHVRALVLISPAQLLQFPGPGNLLDEVRTLLPEELKGEYDSYLRQYLDFKELFGRSEGELIGLNARFTRFYLAAAKAKGMPVPTTLRFHGNGGWMVQALYLSMGKKHDYRAALKRVTAPVLILHGGRDIQPVEASAVYAQALPNAELRTLPEAGHFLFADTPDQFAAMVKEFLDQHP